MAEVAWAFHFQPSEIKRMTVAELLRWHGQACRIQKQVTGKR